MNEYIFRQIIIFHLIFQSVFMAIAMAAWSKELCILYKLANFGISLVLFTYALLIGAAIKADSVDQIINILIFFLVISVVIAVVGSVLCVLKYKKSTIDFYIGAQILFFIITILISHFTVGKSSYLILYPNYSQAAIILYTTFSSSLSVNTGIWEVFNKTVNCSIQFKLNSE
ncbi:unnamed protein product [Schistosoma rodhaini]|uniref:Uncharacterized protein n=1 Tax=Schistosoma rodhaini TaxID=6188 RepID=A0AA85GH45_9TREM|nr:unnamed protein product [Schistosoma rodhaini]